MTEDRPAGQGHSASTPPSGGAPRVRSPQPEPQAEGRQRPGESQPRHPGQRQLRYSTQHRPQSRRQPGLRSRTGDLPPRRQPGLRSRTGDLPQVSLPHAQAQLGLLPRPAPETDMDMAADVSPASTGDDWDQEASLAATVAQIEAKRAAGLIDPDDLDEDEGFLPFGDDWPGKGPAVTVGEADVSAPQQAPVAEGRPGPQQAPVAAGAPSPEDQLVPEVLDAGFLPRGRAADQCGTPPAPGRLPGPGSLPTGNPPVSASAPGPGPSDNRPGTGFASGEALDRARPGPVLAAAADTAAGPSRAYTGVSDDELVGILTAWQRTESWAAAGRLSAAAELIRRRPATGRARAGRAGVPRARARARLGAAG